MVGLVKLIVPFTASRKFNCPSIKLDHVGLVRHVDNGDSVFVAAANGVQKITTNNRKTIASQHDNDMNVNEASKSINKKDTNTKKTY